MKNRKPETTPVDDAEAERAEAMRDLCGALSFFVVCGRKGCRRARRCAGDAEQCFDRFWPHVPEETKVRLRAGLAARHEGLPMDQMTRRMDEAVARFRSGQADTAGSLPQL